jgi:inosose dehydratase
MATSEGSGAQVRVGVSPLSWTNDVLAELGGDVPLEVCLRDAAEIGYAGVELGRKFPRNSRELLPKLSSYGLQLATGKAYQYVKDRLL